MASLDSLNILTNGDFSDDLTGWNVNNPTGGGAPAVRGGGENVSFNAGNETDFGDSIDQGFATTVGNTYAVSLDLIEDNGGNGDHTFQIEILNDSGAVIRTISFVATNDTTQPAGFTFIALSVATSIRITNTTSTSSISTDGKIDNVRVIDVTGDDVIEGSDLGEVINTAGGNDSISALAGNDIIDAGAGNDLVYGGDGADTINGGGGDDILYGGGDIDVYSQLDDGGSTQIFDLGGNATLDVSGFTSGVTVDIGTNAGGTGLLVSGNGTTITANNSSSGIDVLIGTEFDDDVTEFFIDKIDLGGGNDILRTFDNNAIGERFDGGADIDTLDFSDANRGVTFNMQTGAFTGTQGAFNFENAVGGAFGDTINGSAADNSIDAGAGNDDIVGGAGNDILYGGADNDEISAGQGDDTVFGGAGRDFIEDGAGNDTVFGGDGGDQLDGEDGNDILYGGDGDDEIGDFGTGNDTLFGGAGFDALYSGDGDDVIYGGVGNDISNGEGGNDILYGGAGNDNLESSDGEDVLYGGDGNDEFAYFEDVTQHAFGGAGTDTLDLSSSQSHDLSDDTIDGIEILEIFDVGDKVEVTLTAEQLFSFDTITARFFDPGDTLQFNIVPNGVTEIDLSTVTFVDPVETMIFSVLGGGSETITGTDQAEQIFGGDGNDTIEGGAGADTIDGGLGLNTLSYAGSTAGVTIDLGAGAVSGGDAEGDTIANFVNAVGGAGDDSFTGDGNANTITGGAGDDTVSYIGSASAVDVRLDLGRGFTGDATGDVLSEIETLQGSAFADILIGDAQANTLEGSAGGDVIIGRDGIDTASYRSSSAAVDVRLDVFRGFTGDAAGDVIQQVQNLIGSEFDDILIGNAEANTIEGLGGGDVVIGRDGADTTSYRSSSAAVDVRLDLFRGFAGDAAGDIFQQIDNIIGSTHDDILIGNAASNTIEGGAGADIIYGRDGFDFVSYADADAAVDVRMTLNRGFGGDAAGDILQQVEGVIGSAFDDIIFDDANANSIVAGDGDDFLVQKAGNDVFIGGDGSDRVVFSGTLAEYDVSDFLGGKRVVNLTTFEDDRLFEVEFITFADQTLIV